MELQLLKPQAQDQSNKDLLKILSIESLNFPLPHT